MHQNVSGKGSQPSEMKALLVIGLLCCIGSFLVQENEASDDKDECAVSSNKSCGKCISNTKCSWCDPDKRCATFALVKDVTHKKCKGQEWKYKQCIVSGKILIIVIPCVAFVVLVAVGCTIYCCCCRKKKRGGVDKEEAKWKREREEIEVKHKERRVERQQRHDEIRKKYGLFRKEDGKYEQFDNDDVVA